MIMREGGKLGFPGMTVLGELASCHSSTKATFSKLLDRYSEDADEVVKTFGDCLKLLAGWSQPSQVQKNMAKDLNRILSAKIQEHKAIDLLAVGLRTAIQCFKEATGTINPSLFEIVGSMLGNLLSFDRIKGSTSDENGQNIPVQLRGSEMCDFFIDRILTIKWRVQNLIPMTVMMRELTCLGPKRTQSVIDKVISLLPQTGIDETPALLYQLLLLGRGGNASDGSAGLTKESTQTTVAVFNGIIGYFSALETIDTDGCDDDRAVSRDSRKLESQCATHIVLALRHNHWLCREFFKHVKKLAQTQIPRFALMILFSITESYKCATRVPALVKANILNALNNDEEILKFGQVRGINGNSFDGLLESYEELVRGLTFESETALKTLISLSVSILDWNGSNFVKEKLEKLSATIIRTIFAHHTYARQELLKHVIEHLCTNDSLFLAQLLTEFLAIDANLVQSSLNERFEMIVQGKAWPKLVALVFDSQLDILRKFILSNDEDLAKLALQSLTEKLASDGDSFNCWAIIRLALERVKYSKQFYPFLSQFMKSSQPLRDFVVSRVLVPLIQDGDEWNWPKTISDCVDSSIGVVKVQLPDLLIALKDAKAEGAFEAAAVNLMMILDNQAGVRWFSEDESTISQDLKRPLISDLYDSAVALALSSPPNIAKAFRLLNRQRDFLSGCTSTFKSSVALPWSLASKMLENMVEDGMKTHGSDDLFRWIFSRTSTESFDGDGSVIDEVINLACEKLNAFKPAYPSMLEFMAKIDHKVNMNLLEWTVSQKMAAKEIVPLLGLLTYSEPIAKKISNISASDTLSAKQFMSWLLKWPNTSGGAAIQASKDCLALLGEIDADAPDENSFGNEHSLVHFKFINRKTSPAILGLVLVWVAESVAHGEWIMKQIKLSHRLDQFDKESLNSLCRALIPAAQAQVLLTRITISGALSEKLQQSLQKTFKLASNMLAFLMAVGKTFDLDPLRELMGLIAGSLSPNIYTMIPLVQQMESERVKEMCEAKRMKKAKNAQSLGASASRTTRESRLLPALIFHIELFDRHILEIARKSGVTLVDQIHRSTARDFRIQTDELEAALQNMEIAALSDPEGDDVEGNENDSTELEQSKEESESS